MNSNELTMLLYTLGRIFKGQVKGHPGEEEITHMERLDDLALTKVR